MNKEETIAETDNWFSYEPEDESKMSLCSRKLTPCEVIRQVYAKIDDPEIRLQLRILTTMNKSMAYRIKKHEGKWAGKKCRLNLLHPEFPFNAEEDERLF